MHVAKGLYKEWLENDNLSLLRGWKMQGLTDEQIARDKIGIAPRTLEKWKAKYGQISRALKIGKERANFAVENKLFQKALEGNVTAMIFFLKNSYRDKYNDSQLSREERELASQRAKKLAAEATLAEWKANELTGKNKTNDKTVLIDDIGGNDNGNNGN